MSHYGESIKITLTVTGDALAEVLLSIDEINGLENITFNDFKTTMESCPPSEDEEDQE